MGHFLDEETTQVYIPKGKFAEEEPVSQISQPISTPEDNSLQGVLAGGTVGMFSNPSDYGALLSSLISGASQGTIRNLIEHPSESAIGGVVGGNLASGAEGFVDLANLIPGINLENTFRGTGNFPKASTKAGRLGQFVIESAIPSLTGGILNEGLISSLQSSQKINSIKTPLQRAEELTVKLLQPTKSELALELERGNLPPSVKEMAKIVRKSNTFDELSNTIDETIKKNFDVRNNIIADNNREVGDSHLLELRKLIGETGASSQGSDDAMTMKEILLNEENWLKNNKLDRVKAQDLKEKFQDLTIPYLKKQQLGTLTGNESAKLRAYNAIRQGLKRVVESGNPVIANINDTYDGLTRAKELVSLQKASVMKQLENEGFLSKIVSLVKRSTNPGKALEDFVARERDLPSMTKEIEKLMKQVRARKLNESLTEMITNPVK